MMVYAWTMLVVSSMGLIFMLASLWRYGDHDRDDKDRWN
jgi:hypothetical protein